MQLSGIELTTFRSPSSVLVQLWWAFAEGGVQGGPGRLPGRRGARRRVHGEARRRPEPRGGLDAQQRRVQRVRLREEAVAYEQLEVREGAIRYADLRNTISVSANIGSTL